MQKIFNAVWQTLKERQPQKKRRSITWAFIKLLIRAFYWIWRLLSLFYSEG